GGVRGPRRPPGEPRLAGDRLSVRQGRRRLPSVSAIGGVGAAVAPQAGEHSRGGLPRACAAAVGGRSGGARKAGMSRRGGATRCDSNISHVANISFSATLVRDANVAGEGSHAKGI